MSTKRGKTVKTVAYYRVSTKKQGESGLVYLDRSNARNSARMLGEP
jgi:DNA invertase Pin-like site-specific DNA recombinase